MRISCLILLALGSALADEYKAIGNYSIAYPAPEAQSQLYGSMISCFAACTTLGSGYSFVTISSSLWCSVYRTSSVVYSIQLEVSTNTTLWKKLGSASYPPLYVWTTSYDPTLANYWPIQSGTTYDVIKGAQMTSSNGMMTSDRSGNSGSAIRMNPSVSGSGHNLPSGYYLNGAGSFSIVMWIRITPSVLYMPVLTLSSLSGDDQFVLSIEGTTGKPFVEFRVNNVHVGAYDSTWISSQAISTSWSQLAITFNGVSKQMKIFVNANQTASTTGTSLNNVTFSSNYVGSAADTILDGDMDEIKFYKRDLTSSDLDIDLAKTNSYLIPV